MKPHRYLLSAGLYLVAAAMLIVVPAAAARTPEAQPTIASEQLGGTTLTVVPKLPYERAVLRIAGPEDYALSMRFDDSAPIAVDLLADAEPQSTSELLTVDADDKRSQVRTTLPDGRYYYEVVFTEETAKPRVHNGQFVARGGVAMSEQAGHRDPAATPQGLLLDSPAASIAPDASGTSGGDRAPGFFDELVQIDDTNADNLTTLRIRNADAFDWHVSNFGGRLLFSNNDGQAVDFTGLPNSRFGIGTVTPASPLHIVGPSSANGQFRLEDAGGNLHRFWQGSSGLWIGSNTVIAQFVLWNDAPANALSAGSTGVGIGTGFPAADLDIRDVDGNGLSAFRLTAPDGDAWTGSHNHATSNDLVFNLISSPGFEVIMRDRNHPVATLGVQGAVRATQYKTTSSKLRKTAFEAIDPVDVLARLAALPVQAWRFKSEDVGVRHIGPFAEDFLRLFGLGDGKTIATVDADGVLMAAVQGLVQKLEQALAAKDAEIATLETANAELAERVEALERRP